MTPDERSRLARRLGGVLEPVIGQVYFSPECHRNYEALGFDGHSGVMKGVETPDGPAYFTSRGSVMGQVSGAVVAAAFGVFNPKVVVQCVELCWRRTDATTICAARDDGALSQLERVLGTPDGLDRAAELLERATDGLAPAGRPLFAGLSRLDVPDHRFGALWRFGDRLREYRGDCHVVAWVGAGLDAVEIGLLTELFWGLPMRTYARTRGWSDEDFDAGTQRLTERGLIADGSFTEQGRTFRESIERRTDELMQPVFDRLGPDVNELCELLEPWGAAIRAGNGYPASGPHDLAERATP